MGLAGGLSTNGTSGGGGGGGTVTSVTATDTSIVVGGTGAAPTIATGTLDVIATQHAPAADWSNNSHKITGLANGSAASDAAAFGQITAVNAGAYANTVTLDAITAPAANVALNSHKITGLANGSASTDAAAYGQILPAPTITAASYAATVTPAAPANGGTLFLNVGALTGNITIANATGSPSDGQEIQIRFVQDGTGGRTYSFGANYAFGTDVTSAMLPTTASAKCELKFVYNATDSKWRALALARGF
jgi:hypothetical protein